MNSQLLVLAHMNDRTEILGTVYQANVLNIKIPELPYDIYY